MNFGPSGLRQQDRMISSRLLIGHQIPDDARFKKVRFRIPGLQHWLSSPLVQRGIERKENDGSIVFHYRVEGSADESFRLPSIASDVTFTTTWIESRALDPFSCSVASEAWVELCPDEPQPLDWHLKQFATLNYMLSWLSSWSMSPDKIEGINDPHSSVSVLYRFQDRKPNLSPSQIDLFIPRPLLGIELGVALVNWFEIYSKIEDPCRLAISTSGSKELWIHVEFLSWMQALEGLHRSILDGNYMDPKAYEPVKKSLVDAIPNIVEQAHRESLRSRIRYGYQYSLRKRLDELTKRLSEPLRTIILGEGGQFPGSWVETRNYYTHWDVALQPTILEPPKMYEASFRISIFARVLFLQLMGISDEVVIQALGGSCHLAQYLIQLNAREHRKRFPDSTAGALMYVSEASAPIQEVADPDSKEPEV
ncbi:hypothetical protein GETHLI_32590 [Geothrix limicola]|uniref:ApeA N-terminal domain-containing protein n=2 Tax=Geothrix limicola TaxID=2927978 RepID=A0ABQ5QJ94_9BACT|nr:hypothetical protein GETHLI_32590 [Geothrix limicola]